MRRRCLLAGGGALLIEAAACSRGRDADAGTKTPERVISLSPNTTETLFSIRRGESLVGRSRYCDFPPSVSSIPNVGGYVDPSLEAILGLRPDLVIGARGPSGHGLVDRLESRGIRTYFPPTESIEEIFAMIEGLSAVMAVPAEGRRVVDAIRARLTVLETRLRGAKRPRVLMVFGLSPIVVAGPGSFTHEMLERAGCDNAVSTGTRYPTLGLETIIGLDPDLIIDTLMVAGEADDLVRAAPGWKHLRAVREGRVAVLREDAVLRPGPRFADGVARIAAVAHPGLELP